MTAQELFRRVGITTYRELVKKTGLSRQRAHQLWRGEGGIGRKQADLLSRLLGIDRTLLLSIEWGRNISPLREVRVLDRSPSEKKTMSLTQV